MYIYNWINLLSRLPQWVIIGSGRKGAPSALFFKNVFNGALINIIFTINKMLSTVPNYIRTFFEILYRPQTLGKNKSFFKKISNNAYPIITNL